MIAVSQCYSSPSFTASKAISYKPFTAELIQEIDYSQLPQHYPLHHANGYQKPPNCQTFPDNINSSNVASPTIAYNSKLNGVSASLSSSHLRLDDYEQETLDNKIGPRDPTRNFSSLLTPLDLTCNKSNKPGFDSKHHPTLAFNDSKASRSELPKGQMYIDLAASETESGSCFSDQDLIRRQKRREQNKAAAQSYRQRKKSVTELIETEHDMALKRNKQLMAYKANLETEIVRMRSLLQDIAMTSKLKEDSNIVTIKQPKILPLSCGNTDQERIQIEALDYSQPKNENFCSNVCSEKKSSDLAEIDTDVSGNSSPSSSTGFQSCSSAPTSPNYEPTVFGKFRGNTTKPFGFPQSPLKEEEIPVMRPRQNTWPMDKTTMCNKGLVGKDRKKEQNRLASRRFRVRRKMEMSVNEVQIVVLEKRNLKLRRICEDYTKKIVVIKDMLQNLGCRIPIPSSLSEKKDNSEKSIL